MTRVAIVGAGYVGVCTGLTFAGQGHRITFADVDEARVDALRAGRAPFFEPGVEAALRRALRLRRIDATTDTATAVDAARWVFLCVGTPPTSTGSADLTSLRAAAKAVGQALAGRRDYPIVVVKSTVPPGTVDDVVRLTLEAASGSRAGHDFGVASNPEFLREGHALQDARRPDRVVWGTREPRTARRLAQLYARVRCPKIRTDPRTAELIKYAANAFLATRVSFANEMANLCERLGIDWYDVVEGIAPDPRIGPQFFRAGVGFGGSCFPKDLGALAALGRSARNPLRIVESTLEVNERQPAEAIRLLRTEVGALKGRRIALLGLAFKPDTDDVRETRALPIYRALRHEGADVVAYDPRAGESFRRLAPDAVIATSLEEALTGADGAIIQTEWDEFRRLRPDLLRRLMRTPVVVDGRRTLESRSMDRGAVRYRAIGLGRNGSAKKD